MEIFLRILQTIILIVGWFLHPFFKNRKKDQKVVSSVNNSLLKMSATQLAKKIRKREITSTEVVEAYIDRIKEVNPLLNAIVEERFDAAVRDAKKVDELLQNTSMDEEDLEKNKPLLGVPMTVKESCAVEGLSHCVGFNPRLGVKASADGDAVAALKQSGAIPLLVSNTPEMCFSWESFNLITGMTCNPYNTIKVSGGSSGGEGALLGAGASVIGVGSDIAGSIRVPAMFCGVFGHKPTGGLVSVRGHFPYHYDENFEKYLVIGPMARYAEDLKLMTKIMAKDNARYLNLEDKVDLSKIKVYYREEAGPIVSILSVENDIKDAMRKCLVHMQESCHASVKDVKFDEMEDTCELSLSMFMEMEGLPNPLQNPDNPKEVKSLAVELIKSVFGKSTISIHALAFRLLINARGFVPKYRQKYYLSKYEFLKNKFEFELGNNGVFLYPTFPVAAFYHNEVFFKVSGVVYTMIFNILGFPSTHVPLGLNKEGLPVGIQVVASPNQDRLCFAVAEELERKFGGWIEPKKAH